MSRSVFRFFNPDGPKEDPVEKRKGQLRRAQKSYRDRKERYTKLLETELAQVRTSEANLIRECDSLRTSLQNALDLLSKYGIDAPQGTLDLPLQGASFDFLDSSDTDPGSQVLSPESYATYTSSEPQERFASSKRSKRFVAQPKEIRRGTRICELDEVIVGMEFVLTIEEPCLDHIHGDPDKPDEPNGHALTASAKLLCANSCRPARVPAQAPIHSHPIPPSSNPLIQNPPAEILERLLSLAPDLSSENEITPVQAWNSIRRQPQFGGLDIERLRVLGENLRTAVKCHGFGAVVQKSVFDRLIWADCFRETMKVTILGASGETGQSVVKGLLDSPDAFEITALTRQSSVDSPKSQALRDAGVKVVAVDLTGPEDDLVKALQGADVVISTVNALALLDQIPLATAAKKAGVKRFIPCTFATISPPRGVMDLAQRKDDVFSHIKALHLPYTIIDVGWWYQITPPRVPSGRLDGALVNPVKEIFADGNVPSGITDTRDIGRYVAKIITDPRTLNKCVFAYSEVLTQQQVWNAVETVSGETLERKYVAEEEMANRVAEARKAFAASSSDPMSTYGLWTAEYSNSWGVRGDNTPEFARYLGYLDAKELYPDFKYITFKEYLTDALEGRVKKAYA
ncbi:Isoflavone reductase-like protein [Paramyrothecium foliicola]|nr:Isoflavone reductase-like protein [Paramyrothecium foliicola]